MRLTASSRACMHVFNDLLVACDRQKHTIPEQPLLSRSSAAPCPLCTAAGTVCQPLAARSSIMTLTATAVGPLALDTERIYYGHCTGFCGCVAASSKQQHSDSIHIVSLRSSRRSASLLISVSLQFSQLLNHLAISGRRVRTLFICDGLRAGIFLQWTASKCE